MKPQGLTPNFYSVVSNTISESLIFKWRFISKRKEYQANAIVRIYPKGSNTVLGNLTVVGVKEQVNIAPIVHLLSYESEYEWEVELTSTEGSVVKSDRASFRYAKINIHKDLEWPTGPVPYEYIGSRKYFNEIRENAIHVIGHYELSTQNEINTALELNNIFKGKIVPSKKDFTTLEDAIRIISDKESVINPEINKLIKDGLGASDIHSIYKYLQELASIPPETPHNFSLTTSQPNMYSISSATASNNSESDTSIKLRWSIEKIPETLSYISFYDIHDDAVSYYKLDLKIGFNDFVIVHNLFYRVDDLKKLGNKIYFSLNQFEYDFCSSTKMPISGFNVVAVNTHGKESDNHGIVKNINKMYQGVSHYEVQHKIHDLTNSSVIRNYSTIYTGQGIAYTHNVAGSVDGMHHYAIRVVDKSGETSDWYYFGPVRIYTYVYIPPEEPEKPVEPSKPEPLSAPKPSVTNITIKGATITWPAIKNATKYEVKINSVYTVTSPKHIYSNLEENTTYKVQVRALNNEVSSSWASVQFTTLKKPVVTKEVSGSKFSVWRSSYCIKYQNGRVTYPKAAWRTDVPGELIQGEWVELRDKIQDGLAVKAGTKWGNHKSLIYIDDAAWRKLLKDKEIVKVEMYLKRLSTSHGFPNDGRVLNIYTHNYSSNPTGEPMLGYRHQVTGKDWDRGQGHWFTIPVKYGEYLRDGKIKGFGIHYPDTNINPPSNYSYVRFDAKSFKLRIHYK